MDEKSKTELAVLQQLERLSKWQQLRDSGVTMLQVHQHGEAPYLVYRGVGAYDGIGEHPDYDAVQPDEYGFPMQPADFERLIPMLKLMGIHVEAWGGDIENIPSEHLLSIQDLRVHFATEESAII
jgi:hypothetical protein